MMLFRVLIGVASAGMFFSALSVFAISPGVGFAFLFAFAAMAFAAAAVEALIKCERHLARIARQGRESGGRYDGPRPSAEEWNRSLTRPAGDRRRA